MSIRSYIRRSPCTASPDETLQTAAQRMEKEGVGLLAVTRNERLVGVLTDRDVALHLVDGGRDASVAAIREAMTRSPVTLGRDDSLEDALARMAGAHVRRLLVVDGERPEGVVSADDLLLLLSREIGGLGEVLVAQLPAGASHAEDGEGARRRAGHYRREVVTAAADAPVFEVVEKMAERAVGSVVLLAADGRAAGLLTDRDVALRVVAAGLDPLATPAASVMSEPVKGAHPDEPLEEVVARMRSAGVRRMPILEDGRPVGLVSFDDLLVALGRELDRLAECVSGELRRARLRAQPWRMRHEIEDRLEEVTSRLRAAGDEAWRTLGRELEQARERLGQALRGAGPSGAEPARESRVRVRDLMWSEVRTCTPDEALTEPARIMWERDCGAVPVVAGDGSGRVVGMITDRDLCMAVYTRQEPLARLQVKQAMSERVHACHPDDPVSEACAIMRTAQVRRLPVVDEAGHLRGILSLADVAEAAAGLRVPAGTVRPAEVGLVLEAICRPRSQLVRREPSVTG